MKLLHIADLHIGKKVNEYSMLEDQKYILTRIINIIDEERVEAVLIAGDVYDKTIPSDEAVNLLDDFLSRLSKRKLSVFVISGNHDSASRLSFGAKLMENSGIHISKSYMGIVEPVVLKDSFGPVNVYMLPYIKPLFVREAFPERDEIRDYNTAVKFAVDEMNIDTSVRNIILSHQFVTGAIRSDSEEISVGGLDNIDANIYEQFDYAALGHIHRAQRILFEKIRYAGTPLKYSVSEEKDNKSVTLIDMKEKGNISIYTRELKPLRDLRKISGDFAKITSKSFYEEQNTEDYIDITLTDENDIPEAVNRLRLIYPYLLGVHYDNKRSRQNNSIEASEENLNKSPLELFADFYELQNNVRLSDEETEFVKTLIDKIWEENE